MGSKPLAATSQWIAAARARETLRPDALFSDPLADTLAGQGGYELLDRMKPYLLTDDPVYYAIRTRFFDDFLMHAVQSSEARQVVIVAAGMDTRAYRLNWPEHTRIYELDQPELLASKREVLDQVGAEPLGVRVPVGVDLRTDWQALLRASGFDPSAKSVWLLEGILYYLPEHSVLELLRGISSIATPGSRLAAEILGQSTLDLPAFQPLREVLSQQGIPWLSGTDFPEEVFEPLGWDVRVSQPGDSDANFGRWPYPPVPRGVSDFPHTPGSPRTSGFPRTFFVTAQREHSTKG